MRCSKKHTAKEFLMKKVVATLLVLLAVVASVSAKKAKKEKKEKTPKAGKTEVTASAPHTIPEGREVYVAVWDYLTDCAVRNEDIAWASVTPQKLDPQANEYVFSGWGIYKQFMGFQKQGYTVAVKCDDGGNITVTASDFSTVGCNKDGEEIEGSNPIGLGNMNKFYKQQQDIVTNALYSQLNSWTDEEYEQKLNSAITSPLFIQMMANSVPALYFKKFVADNNIVGRTITLDAVLQNLDESPLENYKYMAMTGVKYRGVLQMVAVVLYSNNDKLVSLKNGDKYTINGVIHRAEIGSSGSLVLAIMED